MYINNICINTLPADELTDGNSGHSRIHFRKVGDTFAAPLFLPPHLSFKLSLTSPFTISQS